MSRDGTIEGLIWKSVQIVMPVLLEGGNDIVALGSIAESDPQMARFLEAMIAAVNLRKGNLNPNGQSQASEVSPATADLFSAEPSASTVPSTGYASSQRTSIDTPELATAYLKSKLSAFDTERTRKTERLNSAFLNTIGDSDIVFSCRSPDADMITLLPHLTDNLIQSGPSGTYAVSILEFFTQQRESWGPMIEEAENIFFEETGEIKSLSSTDYRVISQLVVSALTDFAPLNRSCKNLGPLTVIRQAIGSLGNLTRYVRLIKQHIRKNWWLFVGVSEDDDPSLHQV